jgi:maltooligosyltrehalose trehalohydrolase
MIDPQDPRAYHEAVLRWDEREQGFHAEVLALYRELIELRAAEPDLRCRDLAEVRVSVASGSRTLVLSRGSFVVLANLGASPVDFAVTGDIVLATGGVRAAGTGTRLAPETAAVLRRR